jgi:hypothetical protein
VFSPASPGWARCRYHRNSAERERRRAGAPRDEPATQTPSSNLLTWHKRGHGWPNAASGNLIGALTSSGTRRRTPQVRSSAPPNAHSTVTATIEIFHTSVGTVALCLSLSRRQGYRRGVYVSKKSKEFRERAALCQRLAQQTRNLRAKRELEEIARGYLSLAEYHNGETQTVQFVSRMPSLERDNGTHPAEPDATTAPPPPQQASEEAPSDEDE